MPASFCGLWGMRPSLHRISEAGVLPFMPSVSTLGVFSRSSTILDKVMRVLLKSYAQESDPIRTIYIMQDAFSIADKQVSDTVKSSISFLHELDGVTVKPISFKDIVKEDVDLRSCNTKVLRVLQSAEFMNTVGGWIESTPCGHGPGFLAAYEQLRGLDRKALNNALYLHEEMFHKIRSFTKRGDLFIFPTTPMVAPLKNSLTSIDSITNFYDRVMAVTSFSGIGRMPEISIPLTSIGGSPIGVSIAAGYYQDEFLLSSVRKIFS